MRMREEQNQSGFEKTDREISEGRGCLDSFEKEKDFQKVKFKQRHRWLPARLSAFVPLRFQWPTEGTELY